MAKKYTPSGYQIITIDIADKTSGTDFTPVTEDEKILLNIIDSGTKDILQKPILLNVLNSGDIVISGYATMKSGGVSVSCGRNGDNLVFVEFDKNGETTVLFTYYED